MAASAGAQDAIDAKLLADISRIRAIDNHMHGDPVDAARATRWKDDNPLGTPRYPEVVGLQRANPEWRTAWYALYGYNFSDSELPHLKTLLATKRQTLARAGTNWPNIVLDAAGVEIALLNTVRPGAGQTNGRFRWVPYADPLLRPFAGETSWLGYSGGDLSIATLLREVGFSRPPPSLTEYRINIVNATLARWKKSGAVAVKFLSAYARAIDFEVVDEATATPVYLKAVKGAEALTAGRTEAARGLSVRRDRRGGRRAATGRAHPHRQWRRAVLQQRATPTRRCSRTSSIRVALRKTSFVLLHGGWPYHDLAQAMTDKPNTYVDFSAQTFYLGTHQLAAVLRDWLSWHPEKVLFGSDAYSDVDSPLNDWEEKEYLMTSKARRALAIALTAMMQNGEITRERALEIARLVLRDNAMKLYGLAAPATQ